MLTLYTPDGAIPLRVSDYYIKELASGLNELCFTISIWDDAFQLIQEESSIREESDGITACNYLVKAIDSGKNTANIKAQIDLDEWKQSLTVAYNSGSNSVGGIVRAVAPTGWTVADYSGLTYLRTLHLTGITPLGVLEQCRSTFSGVTFRFDNINKVIEIINMKTGTNLGAFVTRDLNLKKTEYKGKSTGFATRLYAYGKDDLSIASVNSGLPYVDNHTYSDRIVCAYWKDERYTVAENLKAAAQERLAELAVPSRSFECDVVDLAKTNPEKYSELDFVMFSVVSLIDQTRSGQKIDHIVVERWIYPNAPQNNKVILSTVAPRIQSQVTQIINSMNDINSIYQQQQTSKQQSAIENATDKITGTKGGNMRAIYDSDGNWTELVIMDTEDILTASKLWRFNIGGLGYSPNGYNGPYTTAITMDGAIVADFITTGTLDASKITVTNLDAGSITTGSLSASRISGGTLDASNITVTNLNASSITAGTLNVDRIAAGSITGGTDGKIAQQTITGGSSGNIVIKTITGGSSGNLSLDTITTSNTGSGINTSLGYADFSNSVFNGYTGSTTVCTYGIMYAGSGAGFTPKTIQYKNWSGGNSSIVVFGNTD